MLGTALTLLGFGLLLSRTGDRGASVPLTRQATAAPPAPVKSPGDDLRERAAQRRAARAAALEAQAAQAKAEAEERAEQARIAAEREAATRAAEKAAREAQQADAARKLAAIREAEAEAARRRAAELEAARARQAQAEAKAADARRRAAERKAAIERKARAEAAAALAADEAARRRAEAEAAAERERQKREAERAHKAQLAELAAAAKQAEAEEKARLAEMEALAKQAALQAEAQRKREQQEAAARLAAAKQAEQAAAAAAAAAKAVPKPAPTPRYGPEQAARDLQRYLVANRTKVAAFGWKGHGNAQVARAQRFFGLTPDGIVGPATRAAASRYGVKLPPRPTKRVPAPATPYDALINAATKLRAYIEQPGAYRGSRARPSKPVLAFQAAYNRARRSGWRPTLQGPRALAQDGIWGRNTRAALRVSPAVA